MALDPHPDEEDTGVGGLSFFLVLHSRSSEPRYGRDIGEYSKIINKNLTHISTKCTKFVSFCIATTFQSVIIYNFGN